MTLEKLPFNKKAKVVAVHGEGALRLRLLDMGVTPHAEVMALRAAPMGDPIEIQVRGYALTLRLDDARNIEVEAVS